MDVQNIKVKSAMDELAKWFEKYGGEIEQYRIVGIVASGLYLFQNKVIEQMREDRRAEEVSGD